MTTIKRNLLQDLIDHLSKKEISLIIGPRQVGKTTLMLLLKDYLDKSGKKTIFLSLDIEADRAFFSSQLELVKKLQLELGNRKGYVFIDEIQRKENAGLFLKGIYDMNLPYKFIVSGSGSIELKEKVHESLAGRKRIFRLNPVSFEEFVNFKTKYHYEDKLKTFLDVERDRRNSLLDEYLKFGGYPRVVLSNELKEKTRIIDEILRSYLEKDISYLLKVEKIESFSSLIKLLAGQIGQLVNYSEIASALRISSPTVKNYFWYAENTFVIKRIFPYFKNLRKEITKSPVVYFYDLGLRNYAAGIFGRTLIQNDAGFLFQNFIFNMLKDKLAFSPTSVHFWRTQDKTEVDFILTSGKQILPIEVKYRRFKKPIVERSLRSFLKKYQPPEAWLINLDLQTDILIDKTKVRFLTISDLLQILSHFN